MDNAPLKGAKSLKWRCRECTAGFRRDRVYRDCGFHPMLKTFHTRNGGCATISKLRWILQNSGVPLMHAELAGGVRMFSLGLPDGRRLMGAWVSGHNRTLVMCVINGGGVEPLDLDTAEMVMRELSPSLQEKDEVLSVGWTR